MVVTSTAKTRQISAFLAESNSLQSQYISQYIPEFARESGNPRNPYVQVSGLFCAPDWSRTSDTGFRRAVLYPLSYWGGGCFKATQLGYQHGMWLR